MGSAWLQFIASGLTAGAIYALVALGFSIIYNASGAINFAQGEFVMIGGMSAVTLLALGLPLLVALPLAVLASVVVGAAAREAGHRAGAPRRHRHADHHHHRRGAVPARAGAAGVGQARAPRCRRSRASSRSSGWARRCCRKACGCWAAPRWRWPRCRGSSGARCSARRCSPPRTTRSPRSWWASTRAPCCFASFGLAAALGALGGVLIAPIAFTSYDAGIMLGLKGFAAAMLGGLGSFAGAVLGGLVLGLLEGLGAGFVSSAYKDAIAFVDHPARAVLHAAGPARWTRQRTCLSARARPRCARWWARPRSGGLLLLAAVIALLPLVLANNYFYEVAILVALNAIVCVGLNLLIGYAGQISLGHAGFFALGGYGSRDPGRAATAGRRWLSLPRPAPAVGAAGARRRAAHAAPEGPLPGDGHARPGRHHPDRHRHRRPPHRRARRHGGAAAGAVRLGGGRRARLVLDRRRGAAGRGVAGAEPDRVAAPGARCARCTARRSAAQTLGIDSGARQAAGVRDLGACSPRWPAR